MIRILVADPLNPKALEKLSEISEFEIVEKAKMSESELKCEIAQADAVVVRSATRLGKDILHYAERLKLIVRAGIGLDNIDTEYARSRNIEVRNTPGATSVTVAEYTVALMLCACRRLPDAFLSMKEGRWDRQALSVGMELSGKTAGIVGFGRIGQEVAKRLLAMNLEVIYHDIREIKTPQNVRAVTLDELLRSSDFILLHVPLTPLTRHMIAEKQFRMIKKGAVLIQVARGGVVDEAALLVALQEDILRAAALDVFEKEPPDNIELVRHPRVFPFPHLGAATEEGQERASFDVVSTLEEFFNV